MAEIKLNKRYKYAGDIFQKLIGIGFDVETATAFLNEVEDADVVEVVRCKDCEHKVNYCGRIMCGRLMYRLSDGVGGLTATTSENFCSYGERKS